VKNQIKRTHETTGVSQRTWLNRTVIGAGVTSALGDFAYETSNVILPGFLAALGLPAAVLGAIEGVADAVASFTKMGAGYIADRLGFRKYLVVSGYALTPLGQGLIALAAGWPLVLAGRALGWFGRGMRGPLRDAIVAEAITPETRGRAFGFHRAMDTVGAVVGPLLGVIFLSYAQNFYAAGSSGPFRFVFWLTLIPGFLAVMSFALLVNDDRSAPNPALRFWRTIRNLPIEFRRYLAAVGAFGIGDFAHSLLILAAGQLLTPSFGNLRAAQLAGLLYVGRNVVQTVVAYPVGVLADRVGHRQLLVAGYAIGTLTAIIMGAAFVAAPPLVPVFLLVVFLLAGVYIAVQDALEASLTAFYVGAEIRSISYGVLGTVNGVGDLISSVIVGMLWTAVSPVAGFGFAAALMAIGTIAMGKIRGGQY
jgi:MFS family permease